MGCPGTPPLTGYEVSSIDTDETGKYPRSAGARTATLHTNGGSPHLPATPVPIRGYDRSSRGTHVIDAGPS